jgi:hypothetical protein
MRDALHRRALLAVAATCCSSFPAHAAKDCFLDCTQNCNRVAPSSARYCETSCSDCALLQNEPGEKRSHRAHRQCFVRADCLQTDRRDGLSGSVSSEGAEVGLASAYDIGARASGTARAVPYGEDKPPALSLPEGIDQALRNAVQGGRGGLSKP